MSTQLQAVPQPLNSPEMPSLAKLLNDAAKQFVLQVQDYAEMCACGVANLFTAPWYRQDTIRQIHDIGVGSLPIVLLSGFFIGAVMVMQTGSSFARFGAGSMTGDVVSLALVRELGPTITGLLVAGRCASGIASELGSMLVTEQIDAMRAMATDPSRKLVSPRVLAAVIAVPLLTTFSVLVGLFGGMIASAFSLHIDPVTFWQRAIKTLEFSDLMQAISKSMVFAFILSTVGCYQGLNVRGGTQGVGRATTQAVVISSVMIIVIDTFLTRIALFLAGKL